MEFDRVTVSEAVDVMERFIRDARPGRIACVNVALYVWSRSTRWLSDYYRKCDLLVPDGMGLYYASRVLGDPTPGVTNAVFIMDELLERAERAGYGVYLLGTREDLLARAIARLRQRYPSLRILGHRDGFFSREEEDGVVSAVKAVRPEILVLGISSVRKDEFLDRNLSALGVPVCLGVGGALDILAGTHALAPGWVRRAGLEWVYRLAQEPRRLWKRYLTTNPVFAWLVLAALVRRSSAPDGRSRRAAPGEAADQPQ